MGHNSLWGRRTPSATPSTAPGAVGHLSFTEILDTSLKVSWQEPQEKNGLITGEPRGLYTWPVGSPHSSISVTPSSQALTASPVKKLRKCMWGTWRDHSPVSWGLLPLGSTPLGPTPLNPTPLTPGVSASRPDSVLVPLLDVGGNPQAVASRAALLYTGSSLMELGMRAHGKDVTRSGG